MCRGTRRDCSLSDVKLMAAKSSLRLVCVAQRKKRCLLAARLCREGSRLRCPIVLSRSQVPTSPNKKFILDARIHTHAESLYLPFETKCFLLVKFDDLPPIVEDSRHHQRFNNPSKTILLHPLSRREVKQTATQPLLLLRKLGRLERIGQNGAALDRELAHAVMQWLANQTAIVVGRICSKKK